jgi:kynurenine formamidase
MHPAEPHSGVRFVEVSHTVVEGMATYPGLPVPVAEVLMDYDASRAHYHDEAEFLIASLHLCGNTGTYVDSPRHRHRNGVDLAGLPLENVAHLPVVVVDARETGARGIGLGLFAGLDLAGKALLVNTGWARHWGTPAYFEPHPFLTAGACELLVQSGVRFVGIDSLNIDDTNDFKRPAHTLLLGAGIPVCEHMTQLERVEPGGFLHAVPIAWKGGATFPVRAYVVYL